MSLFGGLAGLAFGGGVGAAIGSGAGSGGGGKGPGGQPLGGYAGHVGGFGGFGYDPLTTGHGAPAGFPAGLQGSNGFAGAANSIMQGSAQAEDQLRRSYEAMFRHRANAAVQGYGQMEQRMGAQNAAQGLSLEAIQRNQLAMQPQVMAQVGEARAQSDAGLGQDLAQLYKGTGTELTSLKLNEIGTLLQAYNARKARKAASGAATMDFAGNLVGAGLAAFGGGHAAAGAGAANGAWGADQYGWPWGG